MSDIEIKLVLPHYSLLDDLRVAARDRAVRYLKLAEDGSMHPRSRSRLRLRAEALTQAADALGRAYQGARNLHNEKML